MNDIVREQSVEERRKAARESLDAFARESTALADIGAKEASAASRAYLEAKKRSLSSEDASRMMAAAVKSSATMRQDAFESDFIPENKKGFWLDIGAGLGLPVMILLIISAIASAINTDVEFQYVALSAVALLMAAWYLRKVLSRPKGSRFMEGALGLVRVNPTTAMNSLGALVVGAGVLMVGGDYVIKIRESKALASNEMLSAELSRIDAALAMTLAARSTNAEPRQVAALVQDATGLAWEIERNADNGPVIARASLQDPPGKVLVHYVNNPQASQRMLQSELEVKGKSVAVGQYLYGVVEASAAHPANLREMRLRLKESSQLAVLQLPPNTLPPVPGTAILARESEYGVAESIQNVDDIRRSLLVAGERTVVLPDSNR